MKALVKPKMASRSDGDTGQNVFASEISSASVQRQSNSAMKPKSMCNCM